MLAANPLQRRPEALVVLAACLWSTGGVGVKSIEHLSALGTAGLRGLFAAVAMAGVSAWLGRGRSILPLLRRPWVLAAALAYAVMVVSFVLAARLTTATNAILIQYTAPVYVAFASWPLLGEKPRRRDWLAMLGCLVGMLVCVGPELGAAGGGARGVGFAVLSSFGFAGLPLCLRLDRSEDPAAPMLAMTLGNAVAALAILAVPAEVLGVSAHDLGITALLGVFQIALPYVLFGLAVQRLAALKVSLLAYVEPVLTPLWVWLAIGETPGAAAGIGGLVILGALALQTVPQNRARSAGATAVATALQ